MFEIDFTKDNLVPVNVDYINVFYKILKRTNLFSFENLKDPEILFKSKEVLVKKVVVSL